MNNYSLFCKLYTPDWGNVGFETSAMNAIKANYNPDVVGPVCESSDVFGENIPLPECHRGDFIAIRSAGAYGESMSSCYNCRPLPKGVMG